MTRTPENYDGTKTTTHNFKEVLNQVVSRVGRAHSERTDLVLAAWPEIVGTRLAAMSQAVSFADGKLVVKVKGSTLYSLLNQYEKPRILADLKKRFPSCRLYNIIFRIG